MIGESLTLMTVFDVVICIVSLAALRTLFTHRRQLVRFNLLVGLSIVISGLILIGLFYFADLFTMWVMPLFTTQSTAMAAMAKLHLNYSWINILVVTLCISGGFVFITRNLLSLIRNLEESEVNLRHEVSVRQQMNEALRESEARFRNLIEGSLQGIMIHRDGLPLFVNQAFADFLGYAHPQDIVSALGTADLIAPHERARLRQLREDRLAGKAVPVHYEYQGLRKDGTLGWLESRVRVIPWDGVPAFQSTVVDINERKQAEREISIRIRQQAIVAELGQHALQEQDLAVLMDNIVVPLAQTLDVAYCQLLELLPDGKALRLRAGVGWHDGLIGTATVGAGLGVQAGYTLQSNDPVIVEDLRTETRFRGAPLLLDHDVVSGMSVVIQGQDKPFGVLGVYTTTCRRFTPDDIHFLRAIAYLLGAAIVRKQVEEDHKRLEAQLRQAQKMEAIGTLAGGIAHEFNNILGAILGFTDLTQYEVPQGSPAWSNLQEVLKAGRRAKDLVQQILAFSRQSEQEQEPLSVSLVVQDILALLRASLPSTIEIRHHLTEEGGTVRANRTQLYQVVMNLCANAEQAMRETGGVLELGADQIEVDAAFAAQHPDLQPGPHVRLRIHDTGPGMTPDVVERIFEPFFTTKDVGEGTGMGLAIVHGIVTSHGGAITVDSTPGEGTTFAVYLPRSTDAAVTDALDHPAEDLPQGHGRLLFVDDEEMLVRMGQSMFTRLGYEVVACTSSVEALDAFRAEPAQFDLVITDQTMPRMTGEELAWELRHLRPDIPIVLCTGYSHLMNAEKARDLGIDAFCMKPLVARDLAVTVQRVLQQRAIQLPQAGGRILLIDDDEQLRSMLRQMLEAEGYEAVEARHGREGVQRYREVPPDVIIIDLLMPEQEGLETIRQLRDDDPAVKIIAISGGSRKENLNYLHVAKQLGAQRTLYKPFSRDALLVTIRDVLQG